MTLHEKGIEFLVKEEDLKDMSSFIRELHPEAKVPVLVHGETAIYESSIITQYINDQFPQNDLMPKLPANRAEVRLWTYWCDNLFKPEIDKFKYGKDKLTTDEYQFSQAKLEVYLNKLETQILQFGWLVDGTYSLADIHVFPFVRQLSKCTPALPVFLNFPATNKWLEKIVTRPSFIQTMQKAPND